MRKSILFLLVICLMGFSYYAGNRHLLSFREKKQPIQEQLSEQNVTEHKSIVVVIPSYNNASFYKRNLESVFKQTYDNFRVIYIDDDSGDGTYDLVKEYVAGHPQEKRFTLIHNEIRVKTLANLYHAIHSCNDNDIIVQLDGDDEFAHEKVLEKVNAAYADPNIWMTYGQYMTYPKYETGLCCKVPSKIIKNHTFRQWRWVYSHLRTFYAGLFKKIKIEDLQQNGQFFDMASDVAITLPMIEMASAHHKFISDILYIYNLRNPISDHQVNHQHQLDLEKHILSLPPYPSLDSLFEKK